MLVPLRFSHWSCSHSVQALPRPCERVPFSLVRLPIHATNSLVPWSVSLTRWLWPNRSILPLGDWVPPCVLTCCSLYSRMALFSPAARGLEMALSSLRCSELHLCSLPPNVFGTLTIHCWFSESDGVSTSDDSCQAVSKVTFPSTVFEFDSPERFGEKVGRLFFKWNELHFDSVIFYLLRSKVVINLKVFGFFMKNWIVTKFDVALVVVENMGRLVV